MSLVSRVKEIILQGIDDLYKQSFTDREVTLNITKPEFEGDYTVVLFSIVKQLKKSPEQLGRELGAWLVEKNADLFKNYNVIKGFLNLTISDNYWTDFLQKNYSDPNFAVRPTKNEKVMVEYSSPNTNKPLHLGHLRNNVLGWSVAEILKANGYEVIKTCIVNDRGIHICKSMLAWQKYANGATPQSTNMKGDHFVGKYYVMFEAELKKQAEPIIVRIFQNDLSGFEGEDADQLQKLLRALAELKEDDQEKIDKIKEDRYKNILKTVKNVVISSISLGTLSGLSITGAILSFIGANVKTPQITDEIIDANFSIKDRQRSNGLTYLLEVKEKFQ